MRMVREERWWYEGSQICLNGHVRNSRATSRPGPADNYCTLCGAEIIDKCPHCDVPIHGIRQPSVMYSEPYSAPRYCHECSKAYPWTERHLDAAARVIDASKLPTQEKAALRDLLPDLVYETPRTQTAIARMTAFLDKAGPPLAASMRQIVSEVATDAIRKALGV